MRDGVRFVAILGHSDDAPLLDACVHHHLTIGVDAIVVVPMNADEASDVVLARYRSNERVRVFRPAEGERDFDYFTHATVEARAWYDPEWLLYLDSDEFWIPESGSIANTACLERCDILAVERFNVPPLRDAAGMPLAVDFRDAARLPMLLGRGDLERAYLRGETGLPIVHGRDRSPKVLVRAGVVSSVTSGGHGILTSGPLREGVADDLLILHAPFTKKRRFERKLAGVRAVLVRFADRFQGTEAWHWRHWAALDTPERIDEEFARQVVDRHALSRLLRTGQATFPAGFFALRPALAPRTDRERARVAATVALRPLAAGEPLPDGAAAAWFDPWSFRVRYADSLARIAVASDDEAFAAYCAYATERALSPNALFDEARYRAANPDVANGIANGAVSSGLEHFVMHGDRERRTNLPGFEAAFDERFAVLGLARNAPRIVTWFDDAFYRSVYPDVDEAIDDGAVPSALEHFLTLGYTEGRMPHPAAHAAALEREGRDAWSYAASLAERFGRAGTEMTPESLGALRDALVAAPGAASLELIDDALRPFVRARDDVATVRASVTERSARVDVAWRPFDPDGAAIASFYETFRTQPHADWRVFAIGSGADDALRAAVASISERDARFETCTPSEFAARHRAGAHVMAVAGNDPPYGDALAYAIEMLARDGCDALYDSGCASRAASHPLDPYGAPLWAPESVASGFGPSRVSVWTDDVYRRRHERWARDTHVGDLAVALDLVKKPYALACVDGRLCAAAAWTDGEVEAHALASARELVASHLADCAVTATIGDDGFGYLRLRPATAGARVLYVLRDNGPPVATFSEPFVAAVEAVRVGDGPHALTRGIARALAGSSCDRIVVDVRPGGEALDVVALLELLALPGVGAAGIAHPLASGAIANRYAPGAQTFAFRRDAYEAVGGFDERFGDALAPIDLAFRTSDAGFRCAITPYAVRHTRSSDVACPRPERPEPRTMLRFAALHADRIARRIFASV